MRFIKKIFVVFLAFLLLVLIFVNIYVFYNNTEIKEIFVAALNKNLNTEVNIRGSINLSLFDHLPYISIVFKDVIVKGAISESDVNFIEADEISFLFSYKELLQKKYRINKIFIDHADVNIKIDELGQKNYKIWKPRSESKDTSFLLILEKININNTRISYINRRGIHKDSASREDFLFDVDNVSVTGVFSPAFYTLHIKGSMESKSLLVNRIDYLNEKHVEVNTDIFIDDEKQFYKFYNTSAVIEGLLFAARGTVAFNEASTAIDFKISSDAIDLPLLLGHVPEKYQPYLKDIYIESGNITHHTIIKGVFDKKSNPFVQSDFTVREAVISYKGIKAPMEEVTFTGTLDNGKHYNTSTAQVFLPDFSFTWNDELLKGGFKLFNFNNPLINTTLTGTFNLKDLQDDLNIANIDLIQGKLTCKDIDLLLSINNDGPQHNISRLEINGSCVLQDVDLNYKDNAYVMKHIAGELEFVNDDILISSFSSIVNDCDFEAKGKISNLIPYFKELLNRVEKPQTDISIQAAIRSEDIDIPKLLPQSSVDADANSAYLSFFSDNIAYKIHTEITHLKYNKFNATNVSGVISYKGRKINFDNFRCNAMGGEINVNTVVNIKSSNGGAVTSDIELKDVDISKLFYQFENFTQTTITSKHLKGKLTTYAHLTFPYNNGIVVHDSLYALLDISIVNGELLGFNPILRLSKYVDINELKHIRFSKLVNRIEIKDKKIDIPSMYIQSSALNLSVSGSHTFDNKIDYKLKINLLNLLAKKFNARAKNTENAEPDKKGGLNLYLLMTGTVDEPEFKYDKKSVKEKIKENLKAEKEEVIRIIKEEFSKDKEGYIKDWGEDEEEEYIEWDD